jgi:hypothetical protein
MKAGIFALSLLFLSALSGLNAQNNLQEPSSEPDNWKLEYLQQQQANQEPSNDEEQLQFELSQVVDESSPQAVDDETLEAQIDIIAAGYYPIPGFTMTGIADNDVENFRLAMESLKLSDYDMYVDVLNRIR